MDETPLFAEPLNESYLTVYFLVDLFILLYKVLLTVESVDEILKLLNSSFAFLTMNNRKFDSLLRSSSPIQMRKESYRSCLRKKENKLQKPKRTNAIIVPSTAVID